MGEVIKSAMKVLWPHFPKRSLEPILIMHVEDVPMVHYERSARKEILMDLATKGQLWSQLAYQFAHEFCHILANFTQTGRQNLWFEETLCEAASLFSLRHMADAWKHDPPYVNWRNYAASLADYANTVIESRAKISPVTMTEFYQKHAKTLHETPTDRALNGAMAVVLLEQFEKTPNHWEAVTWLNSAPSPVEETFPLYMNKWRNAAPSRHKTFITEIMKLFGVS
jgi:hypothetical protein